MSTARRLLIFSLTIIGLVAAGSPTAAARAGADTPAGPDVMVVTSCLGGNGRVDVNLVNRSFAPADYELRFASLSVRATTVAGHDWGRFSITGRPNGSHQVEVTRRGEVLFDSAVEVACFDPVDGSSVEGPEVAIVNACRFDRGYLLVQLLNNRPQARPYVITFDDGRIPNRSTTAAPFGAAVRAITGRPNGTYPIVVRSGGEVTYQATVTVACDPSNPDPQWAQLGSDINGDERGDRAGASVAMNADGTVMAVGSPLAQSNDRLDAGRVRVYRLNEQLGWLPLGDDIVAEAAGDQFGSAVAISGDGTIVAVGAVSNDDAGTDAGHVRVYRLDAGGWLQQGDDIDGEAAEDESGDAIALSADGSTVAIGASRNDGNGDKSGHVRVFRLDNSGTWTQRGDDIDGVTPGDQAGTSVALSADGLTVAVGAPVNSDAGSLAGHARVFRLDAGGWLQVGDDIDGRAAGDFLGLALSLSDDGGTIAVGSPGSDLGGELSGLTQIYRRAANGEWEQLGGNIVGESPADQAGTHLSLAADGNTVAVGAPTNDGSGANSGQARVYGFERYDTGLERYDTWVQLGDDIDGEASRDQAGAVALSSDGATLALGASRNDGESANDGSNNGSNRGQVRVYGLE